MPCESPRLRGLFRFHFALGRQTAMAQEMRTLLILTALAIWLASTVGAQGDTADACGPAALTRRQ